MTDAIIVALITGVCAIVGQMIVGKTNAKTLIKDLYAELDKRQAVTDTKIENLTHEVRAHNGHGERIAALETAVQTLERRVN